MGFLSSLRSKTQLRTPFKMNLYLSLTLIALTGISLGQGLPFNFNRDVDAEEWETWKVKYGKSYASAMEEKFRMMIYMDNRDRITKHNKSADKGQKSYYMSMNEYGDLLHSEFVALMNGFKHSAHPARKSFGISKASTSSKVTENPPAVDWRDKGAVTPVKNQGQCGSCWAFSTTGSLEGQHYRKTGELLSLSEQNLVDCSHQFGNNGCNGGLMDNAFRYIKANGGVDTESSYPYEGHEDTCHFKRRDVGETDKGFVDIPAGSERALKKAVATVGPVSVAIDASHESFQFYSHGVYDEPECDPEGLDHGVLVVGYGTYEGDDFWLVKNSWSEHWGLDGYIRMARNKDNQCGIASCASYPLV